MKRFLLILWLILLFLLLLFPGVAHADGPVMGIEVDPNFGKTEPGTRHKKEIIIQETSGQADLDDISAIVVGGDGCPWITVDPQWISRIWAGSSAAVTVWLDVHKDASCGTYTCQIGIGPEGMLTESIILKFTVPEILELSPSSHSVLVTQEQSDSVTLKLTNTSEAVKAYDIGFYPEKSIAHWLEGLTPISSLGEGDSIGRKVHIFVPESELKPVGEHSGHIYIKHRSGCDPGLVTRIDIKVLPTDTWYEETRSSIGELPDELVVYKLGEPPKEVEKCGGAKEALGSIVGLIEADKRKRRLRTIFNR